MSLDIEALYATNQPLVRAYVRQRLIGVPDDVIEDLVSDVFERVIRAAPRYRDRGVPPKTWLFQIAKNLLIDHYRHHGRIGFVRFGDWKPYVEHVGTDEHVDQIDVAQVLITYRTGNPAHSPDKQIAALREYYFEGGTDLKIGARLGMSKASVTKLRMRALANLRKLLEAA